MSTDQIRGGPIRGGRVDLRTFLDGAVAAIEDGDIAWAIIDAAWFRGREPTLDQWGSWGDARYAAADLLAALLAGDKDAIVEHAEAVGLLLELEDRAAAHIGPGAQAGEALVHFVRRDGAALDVQQRRAVVGVKAGHAAKNVHADAVAVTVSARRSDHRAHGHVGEFAHAAQRLRRLGGGDSG